MPSNTKLRLSITQAPLTDASLSIVGEDNAHTHPHTHNPFLCYAEIQRANYQQWLCVWESIRFMLFVLNAIIQREVSTLCCWEQTEFFFVDGKKARQQKTAIVFRLSLQVGSIPGFSVHSSVRLGHRAGWVERLWAGACGVLTLLKSDCLNL